jgi:site-specific DNA-methyltransferase (adenine-specific)
MLQINNYKDKHVYQSSGGITSTVYLMDCMDFLQQVPEKYFDLAVVDPPYGINVNMNAGRKKDTKSKKRTVKNWDKNRPSKFYFDNLVLCSNNQIIWGANYFSNYLYSSMGWIFWDKMVPAGLSFSDGELAFSSFDIALKQVTIPYSGFRGFESGRFHPTQKPVKLYDWIYQNYAKPGQVILDTHLGSGSNRIAAHKNNLEFVGVELDPEYFYASVKRFEQYTSQLTLF